MAELDSDPLADVAHLVERELPKLEVAGSSPVVRLAGVVAAPLVVARVSPPREDRRRSASHRSDVPVAGLLRDCIVGITCFPDPVPRSGKARSRRRWGRAKRP